MSISTCALREEGDRCLPTTRCVDSYFYPRPPRGGRRGSAGDHHPLRNFYPRPPRGGRRCGAACFHLPDMISIHALREEGDAAGTDGAQDQKHFYPRPPRGGRHISLVYPQKTALFLSTPSARRATSAEAAANRAWQISIHALREEGDNSFQCSQSSRLDFYPRPPRGGRPYVAGYVTKKTYDFYPRPPRGGRLRHSSKLQQDKGYFYPRPPRGGRPSLAFSLLCNREISIHALREEGDGCSIDLGHIVDVFLSTPSARRATISALLIYSSLVFLSTPSARRATAECIRTRL